MDSKSASVASRMIAESASLLPLLIGCIAETCIHDFQRQAERGSDKPGYTGLEMGEPLQNKYYDSGSGRATRVRDLFASIAPRYDLVNDLQSMGLHRIWKHKLASLAVTTPDARILDLCCGTGDVSFNAAQKGATVCGADFSEAMLKVAEKRRIHASDQRISFMRADALNLPFAPNSFDAVTMSYGLRNLASFEQGIREMMRVVRPGGRLLILDFAKPTILPLRVIYTTYLRLLVPALGRFVAGDGEAYAYILTSLENYPSIEGVSRLLAAHGGGSIVAESILGGVMSLHVATKP